MGENKMKNEIEIKREIERRQKQFVNIKKDVLEDDFVSPTTKARFELRGAIIALNWVISDEDKGDKKQV